MNKFKFEKIFLLALIIQCCSDRHLTSSLLLASNENKNAVLSTNNKSSENCDNPQNQGDMNRCANENYQQTDRELNQIYQQLRDKVKGTNREQKLIQAESAWLKFRDLDCEYESEAYKGGSIEPQIYTDCLNHLTQERIENLKTYLENIN